MALNLEDIFSGSRYLGENTNKEEIITEIERAFAQYPIRQVLMTFQLGEDAPPHKEIYRIISLRTSAEEASPFYVVDRQISCIPWLFYDCNAYCAENWSQLCLNKFDKKINPKNIENFRRKIWPEGNGKPVARNYIMHGSDEEEIWKFFGTRDSWGDMCLKFLTPPEFRIEAYSEGGTDYLKERREEVSMRWLAAGFKGDRGDVKLPYLHVRKFINKFKSTYDLSKVFYPDWGSRISFKPEINDREVI